MLYIIYKVYFKYRKCTTEGGWNMLNRLFGNYLVEKKCITQEQLEQLLPVPQDVRAKMETIVLVRKILMPAQVQSLLEGLDEDEEFGKIAVKEGLISDDRLEQLTSFRKNSFMKFVQLLVNEDYIRLDQVNQIISSFETEYEYTDAQMNSLILNDLEEIIRIFVPLKNRHLHELTVTFVQTLKSLIDKEVYLDKAYTSNAVQLDSYAGQVVNGDMNFKVYISGLGNNLLGIANYFTGDKYESVTEDALDNVGEFINCVNGLFATNLSYNDIMVDMGFPDYAIDGLYLKDNPLFVIPIHANGFCFRVIYEIYQ